MNGGRYIMKDFFLILSLIFLSFSSQANLNSGSNIAFYVFTDPHCETCEMRTQPLIHAYGQDEVIIYDLRQSNHRERFSRICDLIEVFSIPLVGVFKDGDLSAIVVGYFSAEKWVKIVEMESEGVPIYVNGEIKPVRIIKEGEEKEILAKLFIGEENVELSSSQNVFSLLPMIVVAAAVDAINPCAFYVLIVFLSFIFFQFGRKTVLKIGIAYSAAVFITYYAMGFGFLQLFSYIQEMNILVIFFGLSIGFKSILNFAFSIFGLSLGIRDSIEAFFNRKFKRIPNSISKRFSKFLRRASENITTALVIGSATSIFLLPCTSGPYFIALSLIANLKTMFEGLILLIVYNGIMIAPFLAITLGIYTLTLKTRDLKTWSSEKKRWLNLITGILMMLLSFYLLLYV